MGLEGLQAMSQVARRNTLVHRRVERQSLGAFLSTAILLPLEGRFTHDAELAPACQAPPGSHRVERRGIAQLCCQQVDERPDFGGGVAALPVQDMHRVGGWLIVRQYAP